MWESQFYLFTYLSSFNVSSSSSLLIESSCSTSTPFAFGRSSSLECFYTFAFIDERSINKGSV
jgi:hypothetical protein